MHLHDDRTGRADEHCTDHRLRVIYTASIPQVHIVLNFIGSIEGGDAVEVARTDARGYFEVTVDFSKGLYQVVRVEKELLWSMPMRKKWTGTI